jgi:D-glycero-alpha-D-manno-heptose-7-phosphate kinase
LFFTGSAHHSWTILEDQEKSTRDQGSAATKALHEVHRLVQEMRNALEKPDLYRFGSLLDQAWNAKKKVSAKISNPRIDRLYQVARQNGALGGKITGAGGGGFLLLFCDPSCQADVRRGLASEGVREMAFGADTNGAQILANDPFIDNDDAVGSRWTFVPSSVSR